MKRFYKIFASWFLCLFLVASSCFVSFADVNSLMISTGSNALMTLELDDSDYLMMSPRSSLGTVANTILSDKILVLFTQQSESNGQYIYSYVDAFKSNGRYNVKFKALDGYKIINIQIYLNRSDLPAPGKYYYSFDSSSQFSYEYRDSEIFWTKEYDNANTESGQLAIMGITNTSSGDVFIDKYLIDLGSVTTFTQYLAISYSDIVYNIDASFAFNFTKTAMSGGASVGPSISQQDYNDNVSSSLSDLSSSVDSMTEDLSSAAENLEYISTSQNLIIQGIDNVVMHISDQLFAFWNQLFNLIHVPTMAKMDDIISAIQNMDLEIEVNLDGLKQSIQQASQNEIANDNKISADQIANDEANTEEVKDAVKEHGNFIIDGLKGLFIPSDEFFKAYFDDLYAYFSDRFGFLSFPIDLVIRIADLFLTSEKVDAVLTLPSFEISGYKVWDDYSFNFTEFLETCFPFLISAIQTVTSIGLIMAFVNLCQDKWNEVMRS